MHPFYFLLDKKLLEQRYQDAWAVLVLHDTVGRRLGELDQWCGCCGQKSWWFIRLCCGEILWGGLVRSWSIVLEFEGWQWWRTFRTGWRLCTGKFQVIRLLEAPTGMCLSGRSKVTLSGLVCSRSGFLLGLAVLAGATMLAATTRDSMMAITCDQLVQIRRVFWFDPHCDFTDACKMKIASFVLQIDYLDLRSMLTSLGWSIWARSEKE